MIYGQQIEPSRFAPTRSVIDEPTTSPGGNVVLPIGHENHGPETDRTWVKTEHVVLEPEEALRFAAAILALLPGAPGQEFLAVTGVLQPVADALEATSRLLEDVTVRLARLESEREEAPAGLSY